VLTLKALESGLVTDPKTRQMSGSLDLAPSDPPQLGIGCTLGDQERLGVVPRRVVGAVRY